MIGSADNFIRPLVIGGRTQIPTVFLFFGILGGLQAYGFIGMFLGPAVIAILVAFARIFREQYATDRTAPRRHPCRTRHRAHATGDDPSSTRTASPREPADSGGGRLCSLRRFEEHDVTA